MLISGEISVSQRPRKLLAGGGDAGACSRVRSAVTGAGPSNRVPDEATDRSGHINVRLAGGHSVCIHGPCDVATLRAVQMLRWWV